MPQESTRIIRGEQETTKVLVEVLARAKYIDVLMGFPGPSITMGIEQIRTAAIEAAKKGVTIRVLAEITPINVAYCKQLASIADVRHLDGIKGGGMIITDTDYVSSSQLIEEKLVSQGVHSNVKDIVDQQRYLFETLWGVARPAGQKMEEIEQKREGEFMEVITDTEKASKTFANLMRSAENKILVLLPSKASLEKAQKAGVVDILANRAENNVEVRVISPIEGADISLPNHPKFKLIGGHESEISLLIVDDKKCFVVEGEVGVPGGGLILYTNNALAVKSFKSLFDIRWKDLELIDSLLRTARQRDEFISFAAHELRNPITPIVLLAESLKEDLGSRPEIAGIVRNTKRLQWLIQDILDVARIDNNNLVINKAPFDLNSLLAEACADATNQLKDKGTEVAFVPSGELTLNADRARVAQVVYNLLDNAMKFTQKGSIFVSARKNRDEVVVTVKDEGRGIDKKILPKIFDKFMTTSDRGTGIGLYLSKAIVDAHGGSIRGENNSGRGATFTFTLPIS